jgi:hypothetical protein
MYYYEVLLLLQARNGMNIVRWGCRTREFVGTDRSDLHAHGLGLFVGCPQHRLGAAGCSECKIICFWALMPKAPSPSQRFVKNNVSTLHVLYDSERQPDLGDR